MTLFPLWTPARRIATAPGAKVLRCAFWCWVNSWIIIHCFLDANHSGSTILSSSNLFFNEHWLLWSGLVSCFLFQEFVRSLLVVHFRPAKSVYSPFESIIPR